MLVQFKMCTKGYQFCPFTFLIFVSVSIFPIFLSKKFLWKWYLSNFERNFPPTEFYSLNKYGTWGKIWRITMSKHLHINRTHTHWTTWGWFPMVCGTAATPATSSCAGLCKFHFPLIHSPRLVSIDGRKLESRMG